MVMRKRFIFSSVTRNAGLEEAGFELVQLPRNEWGSGDFIAGKVLETGGHLNNIELPNGRMVEVFEGDLVIGALGRRFATLEAVGDWESIGDDLELEALTPAGLFGKATSISSFLKPLLPLVYMGHLDSNGDTLSMQGIKVAGAEQELNIPIILIIGTSMSAGKTTSGKVIIHQLKELGLKVVAAKLTGAARYRDVLSFHDAGADYIFDFVDAGLPSTVCSEDEFDRAIRPLLSHIASLNADVFVVEAGASPLEPYNGSTAIKLIEENIRLMVMCASDPYAVSGIISAFGRKPDVVAGGATNTEAGIHLVKKLTGLKALNFLERDSLPELKNILRRVLNLV